MSLNGMSTFVHLKPHQIIRGGNVRKNFDEAKLQELAESIKENGIIEPLIVRSDPEKAPDFNNDSFELIAGERRLRAAKLIALDTVPARIMYIEKKQAAKLQLIENVQREDLNPIEEAYAYKALLNEHGYTQEKLATELGVSQAHIANRLRLLDLPEEIQENISREIISPSHGRVLAGYKNVPVEIIKKAAETIASDNVPVAKTADLVRKQVADNGMPLYDHWSSEKKPQFKCGKGSECYECEHRAMGAAWASEQDQPYCMYRECWDKKQTEAIQKKVKKAENADVVDIGKLSYNQYEYWYEESTDYNQSECHDCVKRKLGKDRGKQYYCLDPACMKKKKTAMTKIKNKASRDAFQEELQKISELADTHIYYRYPVSQELTVTLDRQALIYLTAQVLGSVDQWGDRKVTVHKYLKDKFGLEHDVLKRGAWGMLNNEWEVFRSLLSSLDERRLLRVIFEWPAVARGLEGAEGWFLHQVLDCMPTGYQSEPEQVAGTEEFGEDDSKPDPVIENVKETEATELDATLVGTGEEKPYEVPEEEVGHKTGEKSQELINEEQNQDPVHALIGRTIRTHYNTGGVVTNVIGPKNDESYTINYKKNLNDRKFCIIHGITVRDGVILCEGVPLTIMEQEPVEPVNENGIEVEPNTYIDDKGRLLFVSPGISGGDTWMTCYTKNGKGSHRLKSPVLPLRNTREEAQFDLDMYAKNKGYKLAAEAEPPCENVQDILETDDLCDVWGDLVDELTDEELLDAIRRETRPSAKSKLRKEARRRKLDTKGVA
ncbi:MAG: Chromosome-partitioning protein Spo0J [Pelotomaculum sp. PtaB.Bin104]|nr:MAG: Chromosome-partitioning protein Spo0J [Pelotomaculum sp. PtaB.Bin104]